MLLSLYSRLGWFWQQAVVSVTPALTKAPPATSGAILQRVGDRFVRQATLACLFD